ncbi:MAG: hypothetical protein CMC05_11985 [Flavobacteriaceae bacterium]|nr:hypothetical protein [Flavobacteriaceae bacterium]
MVDVDLYDMQILTTQEVDLAQVSYVKEIKSQNTYLKYGLLVSGVLICGLILYLNHNNRKRNIT